MANEALSHPSPVFAVLTGDVIGSTRLGPEPLTAAFNLMSATAASFGRTWPNALVGGPEYFRGDAWQLMLARPELALRLALLMRAALRAGIGADTRVSIGIGLVDRIVPDRLSISNGEAFVLSGRALDRMPSAVEMTGVVPERAGPIAQWLPPILHLCGAILRRWTPRQAELMTHALASSGLTQERIAAALTRKVAKQTVQESLAAAGWRPLMEAVEAFERTDWRGLTALAVSPDSAPI